MSNEQYGGAVQEPQDPRPVLWTVGASFDRRADMLWENKSCRDLDQVMEVVRNAIERRATEINVRDFTFDRLKHMREEAS
jgi:hypothetical protein